MLDVVLALRIDLAHAAVPFRGDENTVLVRFRTKVLSAHALLVSQYLRCSFMPSLLSLIIYDSKLAGSHILRSLTVRAQHQFGSLVFRHFFYLA